jgi:hypothetical protein
MTTIGRWTLPVFTAISGWFMTVIVYIQLHQRLKIGKCINCFSAKHTARTNCGMYIVDEWLLFNVLSCHEQVTFRGDGDVRFVLDQQVSVGFS